MAWHPQVLEFQDFMKQTLTATASWYGQITFIACRKSSTKHKLLFILIFSTTFCVIERLVLNAGKKTTNVGCVTTQKSEGLSPSNVYFFVHCVWFHCVLTKTYLLLWADEAAVVSSPLDVLQHISFAVRLDQTHLSLSRVHPYWEVPSHAVTFCVW